MMNARYSAAMDPNTLCFMRSVFRSNGSRHEGQFSVLEKAVPRFPGIFLNHFFKSFFSRVQEVSCQKRLCRVKRRMNRGGTAGTMFQDGCFVPGRVILLYKGSLCRGFCMPEILMFPADPSVTGLCGLCPGNSASGRFKTRRICA